MVNPNGNPNRGKKITREVFFGGKKIVFGAENNQQETPKEDDDSYELFVAILISKGHTDVLNYGYSFFKTCLKAIEKEFKMQIAGMAMAIGVGLFGDKNSYKKLME